MSCEDKDALSKEEFLQVVRHLKIPAGVATNTQAAHAKDKLDVSKLPFGRRLRAKFAVDGAPWTFLAFVVALMLIFGIWQLVTYVSDTDKRAALGWGVIMAKVTAGVLYPTLFFMILSMSRWLATLARYSYWVARFVNFDRAQSFHIKISIFAMLMATLHAIGHLTGTFLYSSRPGREATVETVVGQSRTYRQYVATLPGITGISALGCFYLMAIFAIPWLKRRNYEVFQLSHLLMFPFVGLLMAHGTWAILQPPMLGYWLAFPTLLVIVERLTRICRGFIRIPAKFSILDDDTVAIEVRHPHGKDWPYDAGQYIMLQVPEVSFFQWHPFTISLCHKDMLSLHIKTDGNWTSRLRSENLRFVGLDGPYGAPAQRFYDFERSVLIGSGVGVTPFSSILMNLEKRQDLPKARGTSHSRSRAASRSSSPGSDATRVKSIREGEKTRGRVLGSPPKVRCDFHWVVRDKNYLLWFSDLLNRVETAESIHKDLSIRICTHVTAKRKKLSTLIFRWLLENHRTETDLSPLTGLRNKTEFGRPDFSTILLDHYNEAKSEGFTGKVGVFYCGAPVVGMLIADACHVLTARASEERYDLRYVFMLEVFG
ncbi:FAD-binding domain-domain-containing protein [Protomyces lactucae-debilis]|uniref:FAD-binding domain-domain-containing protein n=1 Tax=Protomyces lactucae-debilis TaxID=2754530 RepID=A0A1Y2FPH6_PROLT|nr:FAD-binding domain-containing protein [Protomyces lactucae-debilis]ORY85106.1 FAD-binding domain-domain-containing protein [Protomyces lactucae-debilis]